MKFFFSPLFGAACMFYVNTIYLVGISNSSFRNKVLVPHFILYNTVLMDNVYW